MVRRLIVALAAVALFVGGVFATNAVLQPKNIDRAVSGLQSAGVIPQLRTGNGCAQVTQATCKQIFTIMAVAVTLKMNSVVIKLVTQR